MPDEPKASWMDPNPYNPSQMGWNGAYNGALNSLSGSAPLGLLAGAGLGYALAPKKKGLKGAIVGGLTGLAAGVGIPAALSAAAMHARSTSSLYDSASGMRQLMDQRNPQAVARRESTDYLNDLYNKKGPQARNFNEMDKGQRAAWKADARTVSGFSPTRWALGSPEASGQAAASQTDYISDAIRQNDLPFSKFQDPTFDLEKHLQGLINKHAPDVQSEWPSMGLAERMIRRYR